MKDSVGIFEQVMTGREGTGSCWWCGGPLVGRKRRYCSGDCCTQYWRHYMWPTARTWAWERYGGQCIVCGKRGACVVHHIIPLRNSQKRMANQLNVPCNLIVLCLGCHGKWHSKYPRQRLLDETGRKQQMVMKGVLV